MIEKVNPDHPDKVADRIAGALVDMAYCPCEVVPVEDLEGSERGTDGHGSTGVR